MSKSKDPAEGFEWSAPRGLSPKEAYAAFLKAAGEFRSRMAGRSDGEIAAAVKDSREFADLRMEINGDRRRERAEKSNAERRIVSGRISITADE